jgi:hypothetical protein
LTTSTPTKKDNSLQRFSGFLVTGIIRYEFYSIALELTFLKAWWHTAHFASFFKKEVARGGERTRVLLISFIFTFFITLPLNHSGSPPFCKLCHTHFISFAYALLLLSHYQEPILQLLTLQLQRQRCSRLERFYIGEKYFLL